VAVIVAVIVADTDEVVMVKEAEAAPEGTETDAGTTTLELLDEIATASPPGPAGPERETVPVAETPAATAVGATARPAKAADVIVRVAVCETEPAVAVIVALTVEETPTVAIVNEAAL